MKVPRDVSGAQAVKALRRLGFEVMHQQGSRIRMAKGSIRLTVPNYDPSAPKTLQSLVRQSSVSIQTFIESL